MAHALAALIFLFASVAPAAPAFSAVAERTPDEAIAYLSGQSPSYAGSGIASVLDFSPSDILETMDTIVLDRVRQRWGQAGLERVYQTIAGAILDTLREQYGDAAVVVALDAGHGGKQGYYWDPGSEGTEAMHARGVVAAMQTLALDPAYASITIYPIFNDEIADDFGLPRSLNKPVMNPLLMRQVRAAMLANEVADWNAAHPALPLIYVHELSIHFNAGAGGAMVLHQGETVRPEFYERSVNFARAYLDRVLPALNASGLLGARLGLWGGNGLHDDRLMYRPDYLSDAEIQGLVLRYNGLQGGGYLPRYAATVIANH